jgi:N6-adenosine-specific RNA methylase IME4
VIVADPKNSKQRDDLRQIKSDTISDCALFLWANIKNLKQRLIDLEAFGFELKSIGIFDTETRGEGYFDDVVEFILVGVRGNIKPSDYEPQVFWSIDDYEEEFKGMDKTKYDIVYYIAEKIFPGQHYINPFKDTGRDSWGKPTVIEVEAESEEIYEPD